MNDRLKALLARARNYRMTPEEREAQHISFAYGNAKYENDKVTRDGIIRASEALRGSQDLQAPEE